MNSPFDPPIPPLAGTRRDWLAGATLGAASWAGAISPAGELFGAEPAALPTDERFLAGVRRVRSVIVVFTSGGQSQLDLWDPKPHAPREIRGEFSPFPRRSPAHSWANICPNWPRWHTSSRWCGRCPTATSTTVRRCT